MTPTDPKQSLTIFHHREAVSSRRKGCVRDAIPDQDFKNRLIDQARRVVSFDLEYEGAPWKPIGNAVSRITEWKARETEGEEWWWKEHPRMTAPKPNNPIFDGLNLLDPIPYPQFVYCVAVFSKCNPHNGFR